MHRRILRPLPGKHPPPARGLGFPHTAALLRCTLPFLGPLLPPPCACALHTSPPLPAPDPPERQTPLASRSVLAKRSPTRAARSPQRAASLQRRVDPRSAELARRAISLSEEHVRRLLREQQEQQQQKIHQPQPQHPDPQQQDPQHSAEQQGQDEAERILQALTQGLEGAQPASARLEATGGEREGEESWVVDGLGEYDTLYAAVTSAQQEAVKGEEKDTVRAQVEEGREEAGPVERPREYEELYSEVVSAEQADMRVNHEVDATELADAGLALVAQEPMQAGRPPSALGNMEAGDMAGQEDAEQETTSSSRPGSALQARTRPPHPEVDDSRVPLHLPASETAAVDSAHLDHLHAAEPQGAEATEKRMAERAVPEEQEHLEQDHASSSNPNSGPQEHVGPHNPELDNSNEALPPPVPVREVFFHPPALQDAPGIPLPVPQGAPRTRRAGSAAKRTNGGMSMEGQFNAPPAMMSGLQKTSEAGVDQGQEIIAQETASSSSTPPEYVPPYHPEVDYSRYPPHLGTNETAAYDPALLSELYSALAAAGPDELWDAYHQLAQSHPLAGRHLHPATLHRIAEQLVKRKPRTREGFLRLLAVLNDLRKVGGEVRTYQWNALADFAGKGFRVSTVEDWGAALGVYKDMLEEWHARRKREAWLAAKREAAGTTGDDPKNGRGDGEDGADIGSPDIITYNTLLSVAARTGDEGALTRAIRLLSPHPGGPEKMPPADALTLLSLIPHYTALGTPEQGAEVLRGVIALGKPLQIDAFNAVMWAYARNRQVDVAADVYAALRAHQAQPHGEAWKLTVPTWDQNPILSLPGLAMAPWLMPDEITYSLLIQQFCYDGRLNDALQAFRDMVTPPAGFAPSMTIFRAIFVGFARHAGDPNRLRSVSSLGLRLMTRLGVAAVTRKLGDAVGHAFGTEGVEEERARAERAIAWNLATLEQLFASFIKLEWDASPTSLVLYWILMGYAKATGNDWTRLLQVWETLEGKFGTLPDWERRSGGSRLTRVVRRIRLGMEEESRNYAEEWQSRGQPPQAAYRPPVRQAVANASKSELWEPGGTEFEFRFPLPPAPGSGGMGPAQPPPFRFQHPARQAHRGTGHDPNRGDGNV